MKTLNMIHKQSKNGVVFIICGMLHLSIKISLKVREILWNFTFYLSTQKNCWHRHIEQNLNCYWKRHSRKVHDFFSACFPSTNNWKMSQERQKIERRNMWKMRSKFSRHDPEKAWVHSPHNNGVMRRFYDARRKMKRISSAFWFSCRAVSSLSLPLFMR